MLIEPLRRQLYKTHVSKHFLASAIVWGFGVCRWDGSLGGVVSGWQDVEEVRDLGGKKEEGKKGTGSGIRKVSRKVQRVMKLNRNI